MPDSEGIVTRYTTRVERDKLELIEDKLAKCIPVLALAFRDGVLFATASVIAGVKKVRTVHPKGLVFAGTGEAIAIQQVGAGLINCAHLLELRGGGTGVTAEAVIAESETSGILGIMRSVFVDSRMRPVIGDFMIAELHVEKKRTTFHYISATGDRDAQERFCVLGGKGMVDSIDAVLKDETHASQSRSVALRLARHAWDESWKEGTPQFAVVTYAQPQCLEYLRREEERHDA